MRHHRLILAGLAILHAHALSAQQARDFAPYLTPDRNAEIALARSAAPSAISDSATVLVLTRTGLVEAVKGSNGFTCFVLTAFFGRIGDPEFWNPRTRAPHCLNRPATLTVLPEMRKRAEWILAGLAPAEVAARTAKAYATHELPLPAPGAMAYMLSPRQHLVDSDPHWMPHLMFYYDGSMPGSLWGAAGESAPIIDGSADDPHPLIRTILIPVGRWSDGTPAHSGAGH